MIPKNRDLSPAAISSTAGDESSTTDRPLPRAKSAIFPVDTNANRLPLMSLGMLESALSTEGQIHLVASNNNNNISTNTPNSSSSFAQIATGGRGRPSIDGGGGGGRRQYSQNDYFSTIKSMSTSTTHLPILYHHHHPHFASHSPHHHHQQPHQHETTAPQMALALAPQFSALDHPRTFQFPSSGGYGQGPAAGQGQPHRRRSSIILNKRAPARHTESMELGERTGSKLTLDEELYDIIYAFLEVDRDKDEDEEAAGVADPGGKPLTRQHLLNKIREKKEVINKLRCQAWNMNRKRRTLRLAQKYLEQNESKVSRTHLYKEELVKRWRQFLRWLGNIWIYFVPWESRIKRIESQFGSVVSSYFTFLRWVIFINFAITIVILAFIVVPECIADAMADPARQNRTAGRKRIPPEAQPHADELAVVWHFDGYLRFSPLFYGFYSNDPFISDAIRYPLPLAYFLATLFVFLFSLIVIPRRIARNARISKLSGTKAEQYVFNWKLFTGWDYSIGNAETASNAAMAAVIKLREAINESRSYARKACVPSLWAVRVITNAVILGMIVLSVYCIQAAMSASTTIEKSSGSLFTKNQVPLLMSTITHIFPMIFDLIGRAEKHHARTALRLHLIRISALYIINYVTLMLSLFEKLDSIRDTTRKDLDEEDGERIAPMAEKWQWRIPGAAGNTHPFRPQPDQPFLSRNFSKPRQWKQFFMGAFDFGTRLNKRSATTTMAQIVDDQTMTSGASGISTSTISAFTSTSTHANGNGQHQRTKGGGRITVDGTSVTVHAQFGPVGVNNPSALMRNSTLPPMLESSPYETRRVGPTPLPVFTPPPLPPTQRVPTFKGQNFGPDWQAIQREREKERERKRPTPAPTPANITVERPIHGLPYAKMETSSTTTTTEIPAADESEEEEDEEPPLPPPEMPVTSTSSTSTNSAQMVNGEDEEDNESKYNEQICWETMIGQEIVKLVTMDLYITIVSIFLIDFLRGIWIRYCSSWWCWDIETTFPEYGEFKVAENVLHICNNQGMVWLGLFFAPLLPAINSIKLVIIMYIRGWACTTCNVPAREIFRASRSSSFFLYILLSALLLCTIPVGYVITMKRPSVLCGPFAGQSHFYSIITDLVKGHVNKKVMRWLRYITSPGVIFPIILLLILFIFFLFSMVRGLRKANTDLQKQLIHERTEEKRKIFELAGGGSRKKVGGTSGMPPPNSATAVATAAAATHQHNQLQQQKGQRKIPSGQHLPEVERKRREPWRLFNNVNHKGDGRPSLCPSDEPPSSLNSPGSDESPTEPYGKLSTIGGKQSTQRPTILDYSPSKTSGFRPSLGSLEEGNSLESGSHSSAATNGINSNHQIHPQGKLPFGHLPNSQTQPLDGDTDIWQRERRSSRNGSSTPEEVRDLIAPYQTSSSSRPATTIDHHHHFPPSPYHHSTKTKMPPSSGPGHGPGHGASISAVSLAGFPRDCPPLAILFGTASSLGVSSQFASGGHIHRPSSHSPSMKAMAGSRAESSSPPSKSVENVGEQKEKERIEKKESVTPSNNGELEEKFEEYDDIDKQSIYDELNSPATNMTSSTTVERPKRLPLASGGAIHGRIVVHQQQPQQRSFSKIYRLPRGAQPHIAAPLARPESSISTGTQRKMAASPLVSAAIPAISSATKEAQRVVAPSKATFMPLKSGKNLVPTSLPADKSSTSLQAGMSNTRLMGTSETKKDSKDTKASKDGKMDEKVSKDNKKLANVPEMLSLNLTTIEESTSLPATEISKPKLLPANMPTTKATGKIKSPLVSAGSKKREAKEKLTMDPDASMMTRSDVFPGGTPSMEAPHRIALYSKEPRRIGIGGGEPEGIRQLSVSPSRTIAVGNSGEKKRRKENNNKKSEKDEQKQPRIIPAGPASTSGGTKTLPGKLSDQFVPWPSPDEIRKQRSQLLRPTGFGPGTTRSTQPQPMQQQQEMEQPLPIFTTGRARSPPKMIKSVHSATFPQQIPVGDVSSPPVHRQLHLTSHNSAKKKPFEPILNELTPPPEAPPRRFRITVSPKRGGPKLGISQEIEFQQQSQRGDDPEKASPPRRFVIKQQVFTGSTSTFGGSSASGLDRIGPLTAAGRKQQQNLHNQQQQLQAPRVEFGEDDSPRIEMPPSTSGAQMAQQRFHPGSGGNFSRR